jgi:pyruvate dehydrogenase E1 component beta subunit
MMTITYWAAIRASIEQAMASDKRVVLMTQAAHHFDEGYGLANDLSARFSPERVRICPLSAADLVCAGIGAALGGLKPVLELSSANSLSVLAPLVSNAASLGYKTGGQLSVPLVIRMIASAAQPSPSLANWIAQIPGIKVLVPATVTDAHYMLAEALADPDPTVIFEHRLLYTKEALCAPRTLYYSAERALVRRPGNDLTLIAYSAYLDEALAVAERLQASDNKSIEVIDLRCLRPLDSETLFKSVRKTHRAALVDESWETGSFAAEICAQLVEHCWPDLHAPIRRVCSAEVPLLYPDHLTQAARPQRRDIEALARSVLGLVG